MQKTISSTHIIMGALFVGAVLSLFASSSPDGLEKVGENVGFFQHAAFAFHALIPDYAFPGIAHDVLATSLAGVVGTLLVGVILFVLGKRLFCVPTKAQ
jgi:cobalt/nickel transport protein